jgi:hypothetical protein
MRVSRIISGEILRETRRSLMAFKLSYTDADETVHPNAYHKIGVVRDVRHISEKAGKQRCRVKVFVFHDQAAREADEAPVGIYVHMVKPADYTATIGTSQVDPVDTNHIKLLYDFVKAELDDEDIVNV